VAAVDIRQVSGREDLIMNFGGIKIAERLLTWLYWLLNGECLKISVLVKD
jgi:hypothetical protein